MIAAEVKTSLVGPRPGEGHGGPLGGDRFQQFWDGGVWAAHDDVPPEDDGEAEQFQSTAVPPCFEARACAASSMEPRYRFVTLGAVPSDNISIYVPRDITRRLGRPGQPDAREPGRSLARLLVCSFARVPVYTGTRAHNVRRGRDGRSEACTHIY